MLYVREVPDYPLRQVQRRHVCCRIVCEVDCYLEISGIDMQPSQVLPFVHQFSEPGFAVVVVVPGQVYLCGSAEPHK